MPRVSEAEKQKSHDRILEAASQLLREEGIENTSVSDVMKAAGMTHGGFYRHFPNKEALVDQAFAHAVGQVIHDMEHANGPKALSEARGAYIDLYLSMGHITDRRTGCPMAALASEIGRYQAGQAAAEAVNRVAGLLQDGSDASQGYAVLAQLVGAISIARLAEDDATRGAILAAARSAIGQISRIG